MNHFYPSPFPVRVYYEDTDTGGVVYYANYMKFAERARTEWLRALGFDQSRLIAEDGVYFVVRRCSIEFLSPARLDDLLAVETRLKELGKVRMTMQQLIKRADKTLVQLDVELACISTNGKPTSWPQALQDALK